MIGRKTSLILERFTETTDSMGTPISSTGAGAVKTVKGVLSTIRGAERLSADKLTVIADYYFYCDYPKNYTITEEDRFSNSTGGRNFKIIHINNLGANQNRRYRITLKEEI